MLHFSSAASLARGIGEPLRGADRDGGGRQGKTHEEWVGRASVSGFWDFLAAAEKAFDSKPGWRCLLRRSGVHYRSAAKSMWKIRITAAAGAVGPLAGQMGKIAVWDSMLRRLQSGGEPAPSRESKEYICNAWC